MAQQTIALEIKGMTCVGCAQNIEQALKRQKGVKLARLDWRGGTGEVTLDPEQTNVEELLGAPIFRHGYTARLAAGDCCG